MTIPKRSSLLASLAAAILLTACTVQFAPAPECTDDCDAPERDVPSGAAPADPVPVTPLPEIIEG